MSNGAGEVCIAAVTTFRNDVDILEAALRVCVELCQVGAPQRRRLVEAGILLAVVNVMKGHPKQEDLLVHCVNILQLLVGACRSFVCC